MGLYNNVLFYLHNKKDNHDKIYGAIMGGNHVFSFYGRRNPTEDPKEKSSLTIGNIGEGCEDFHGELVESGKILFEKINKGYCPLFINNVQIRGQSGYNEPINSWQLSRVKNKFIIQIGDDAESTITHNYHNFESTIKKKLAKKIMIRK